MRLKEIIASKKHVDDAGTWKVGKLSPSAFPLSKSKLRISSYRWKVMKFRCLGKSFRLLIAYRTDKEVFFSYLAQDCDGDMKVLARYEFHSTHEGWHLHTNCESKPLISGRTGGLLNRLPAARTRHRRMIFDVTGDTIAQNKAIKTFKLDKLDSDKGELF